MNHNPLCSCPAGRTGNPFSRCYDELRKFFYLEAIFCIFGFLLKFKLLIFQCCRYHQNPRKDACIPNLRGIYADCKNVGNKAAFACKRSLAHHQIADQDVVSILAASEPRLVFLKNAEIHVLDHVDKMLTDESKITFQIASVTKDTPQILSNFVRLCRRSRTSKGRNRCLAELWCKCSLREWSLPMYTKLLWESIRFLQPKIDHKFRMPSL